MLWEAIEINYILDKGYMLFKPLGINQSLHVVNIEGYDIDTDIFLQHSDIFGYNDNIFEHIQVKQEMVQFLLLEG